MRLHLKSSCKLDKSSDPTDHIKKRKKELHVIQAKEFLEFFESGRPSLPMDILKQIESFGDNHSGRQRISAEESSRLLKRLNMSHDKKMVTIAALKGGIGKTFLSTSVAIRTAMFGAKVLLVDLDPEACATNGLLPEDTANDPQKITILEVFKNNVPIEKGIMKSKYPNLDLLPAALRISKTEKVINGKNPKWLLKKLVQDLPYDLFFFELPPSFSTLSSAAYIASDLIVIPCTPNIHALESVDLTIEAVNEVCKEFECKQKDFKVILNMFNPHRTASQDTLNLLMDEYASILYPFQIREYAEIQNAINAGQSIYDSKCSQKIRQEMDSLVRSVCPIKTNQDRQHSQLLQ